MMKKIGSRNQVAFGFDLLAGRKWAQGLTRRQEGELPFPDCGDKPGSRAFAKSHTLKHQGTKGMQENGMSSQASHPPRRLAKGADGMANPAFFAKPLRLCVE
jgi:hypothetical protein